MIALLALVLAAAPLEVRVLERSLPETAHLDAKRFTCDGKPLEGTSFDVAVSIRELKVGTATCNQVLVDGPSTVKLKSLERVFPGQLKLSLEGSRMRFINVVDVEEYLPSVTSAEADGAKPAALEAQAIVSRTFALAGRKRHESNGYHLCDLAHCQVYRGASETTAEAKSAVQKTRDQVLLIGGIVLKPAFFHSSCGGHTSRAVDVFGEDAAGSAVSDVENGVPRCKTPEFAWSFETEKEDLAKAFNVAPNGIAFEPLKRDQAGRVSEVRVFGKRVTGQEFMSRTGRAFGWQSLRSMKLKTSETDTTIRFDGTGLGHGVGLCQLGAKALADQGVDAKGILLRYFPESKVGSLRE